MIATSTEKDDDLLTEAAEANGLPVVRGSLEDPLARFIQATSDMQPKDIVVRITADNPVPDGDLLATLIDRVTSRTPYARVGGGDRSLPYGLSAEAFSVEALRRADAGATRLDQREHVTVWMREHLSEAIVTTDDLKAEWGPLRCTVDTFDDYMQAARLFAKFPEPVGVGWREVLDELHHQVSNYEQVNWNTREHALVQQTRLIIGTAQLGDAYGATNIIGKLSDVQVNSVLRAAARHGVSHIDTARAYGSSESRIGRTMNNSQFAHLGVITKVAPLESLDSNATPEHRAAVVRASTFESLTELKTSSVDVLLVHRAEDWFRAGVRDELLRLRAESFTGAIGASISAPSMLEPLLRDEEVQYIQLPFNLVDRRWLAPEVLQLLATRPDVTFTVRSVFLQGLLSGGKAARWPSNLGITAAELRASIEDTVRAVRRRSAADLALAYVLGHDWVSSVVVGAETAEQVDELVTLCNRPPLTEREIEIVADRLPGLSDTGVDPSKWEFA